MLIFGHGTLDAGNLINSRESFAIVHASGADGVELDVRRCADDSLVVIHDPDFDDGRPVVEAPGMERPDDVLLLDEALELCAGLIVNIEIKNYPADVAFDPSERVVDLVAQLLDDRERKDRVLVSCFGIASLDRTRVLRPDLDTAHLVFSRKPAVEVVATCVAHGHNIINPYAGMVDQAFMDEARSHGLRVNVWSGWDETAEQVTALAELGVDGIITGHPARAIGVLGPR